MRIAFLIQIHYCNHTKTNTYTTIDQFIQLNNEQENIETKIMKKYPALNYILHCNDNIVYNEFELEFNQTNVDQYLIVSQTF